jgi:hypothetical protein
MRQAKGALNGYHLVKQMKELGGIADMPDDIVEHHHQARKKLKQRTWNLPSFEKQVLCQLSYHRRKTNVKILEMEEEKMQLGNGEQERGEHHQDKRREPGEVFASQITNAH